MGLLRVRQQRAQVAQEGIHRRQEAAQRVAYRLGTGPRQVHVVVTVRVEGAAGRRDRVVGRPGRARGQQKRAQAGDQRRQLEEGDLAGHLVGVADEQVRVAAQVLCLQDPADDPVVQVGHGRLVIGAQRPQQVDGLEAGLFLGDDPAARGAGQRVGPGNAAHHVPGRWQQAGQPLVDGRIAAAARRHRQAGHRRGDRRPAGRCRPIRWFSRGPLAGVRTTSGSGGFPVVV